nr:MAG TPA: hypothetical protein [Caudoviricetes sp.]
MRTLIIDLRDVGGKPHPEDYVLLQAPALRGSVESTGAVIMTAPVHVDLTDGKAEVQVEPGPLLVQIRTQSVRDSGPLEVIVPEGTGPVSLRTCIERSFQYRPAVESAVAADADRAYAALQGAITAERAAAQSAKAAATAAENAHAALRPTPPASATVQGKIQLAGDLTGTAAEPKVITAGDVDFSIHHDAPRAAFVKTRADGQIAITTPSITKPAHATNKDYVDKADNKLRLEKADKEHTHQLRDIQGLPSAASTFLTPGQASLMIRSDTGNADIGDPITAAHIANKGYVDTKIKEVNRRLDVPEVRLRWEDGGIIFVQIGAMVWVAIQDASAGVRGTVPPRLRPPRDVDFFLTSPEKRSANGWCTITQEGVVSVNFSDPAAKTGYGMGMYIRDFSID